MTTFPKPKIVVSKCLGFAACRYNGQMILDHYIDILKDYVNFIPICPESEIGLGVPRHPVRLVDIDGTDHMIQPATEHDVTKKMVDFSNDFLKSLEHVDGFILKHRSPSCGPGNVRLYIDAHQPTTQGKTTGLFAQQVKKTYKKYPIEDEGRLKNFKIRENFLTKIYCFTRFRLLKAEKQIHLLTQFHAAHKFLFMSYDQNLMRVMGKIAANPEHKDINSVLEDYEEKLKLLMNTEPSRKSIINVLYHLRGYFSKTSSTQENDFFEETIELYREKRIPLSSVTLVIKAWALRDKVEYLLNQVFLNPFPDELMELRDSGREINL